MPASLTVAPLTVAIVEDDDLVAIALAAMLERAGATVVAAAHTYEDAITLVESGPRCAVVFVDLTLHGQPTGIDVARRAARAGLAVVIVTGGGPLTDELPGAALLEKPFSAEHVRAILDWIRRGAGAGRGEGVAADTP